VFTKCSHFANALQDFGHRFRPVPDFRSSTREADVRILRGIGWILVSPVLIVVVVISLLIASPFLMIYLPWITYRRTTNRHPIHWLRAKYGLGKSPEELATRIGLSLDELRAVPIDYVEAFIPKRSGGSRRLLVPGAELKAVQRKILHRVLAKLTVHPAVTGFESGQSIVHNANQHVGQKVVLKMDIEDFFPSTTAERITKYFQRVGWNRAAAELLATLTTHENGLPQGAPTSPRLSNLVNRRLDTRIAWAAKKRRATYTRYADDITISFPGDNAKRVRGMVQYVRHRLLNEGYRNNRQKEIILRQHQQQRVTGLVVNERVNLPRETRRRLRAIEHRLNTGQSATMTREQLEGWKALLAMIEKQRERQGGPSEASPTSD
jgi:retron-type reverse transcriptase